MIRTRLGLGLCLAAALCSAACSSNKDDKDHGDTVSGQRSNDTYANWNNMEPDARVLSILHAKNQEEVQMGKLAQEKGSTDAVRNYGDQLVRDHRDNDSKVLQTARTAKLSLMKTSDTNEMLLREKGQNAKSHEDQMTQLRSMSGTDFDRAFARMMSEGHTDLIQKLEQARPTLRDSNVRQLVNDTLPVIRQHQQTAQSLPR